MTDHEAALRHAVTAFAAGRVGFWAFHNDFIERVVRTPAPQSTFLRQRSWRQAYLAVCRSLPDPVRPEDRAAGMLGEADLRAHLVGLLGDGR